MMSFSHVFAFQIIEMQTPLVWNLDSSYLVSGIYQASETQSPEISNKSESLLDTEGVFSWAPRVYRIQDHGYNPRFSRWNCTAYVAQNKSVTWRWNANQWIRNAKAQWVPTGKAPAVGAIIQLEWHGYNPYYWHVGIVVWIKDTKLVIKDMNYQKLNTVTIREIPKDHPAIKWYIYVD
jgi:surface antigen